MTKLWPFVSLSVFIHPFEKGSYYVIPLASVRKLFRFRVTPPTVYVGLS